MNILDFNNKKKELFLNYQEEKRQLYIKYKLDLQKLLNDYQEDLAIKESLDKNNESFFLY